MYLPLTTSCDVYAGGEETNDVFMPIIGEVGGDSGDGPFATDG
jgi:hypothetical protein